MPGKAGTGATAQMASSGCLTGLWETGHTLVLGVSELRCPLPGRAPAGTLVYKHQEAWWRRCLTAETGSGTVGYGAARRVRTGCAGATLAHEPCCKANERINSTERHVGGYKEYHSRSLRMQLSSKLLGDTSLWMWPIFKGIQRDEFRKMR